MTFLRTLPVLVLALGLAACDTADPEPEAALVTVDVVAFEAFGNCESSTNPGDFQFQVALVDAGNNVISSTDFPTGLPYGTHPSASGGAVGLYAFNPRQRRAVDGLVSAERARDVNGTFGVRFSGMEWDTQTTRDARFDDVQQIRSHPFEDGLFQRVAGEQSIVIGTTSDCRVELEYRLTIQ
ncbi:MAG: hypothetical protein AAF170_04750 [Bacteroidota bacterium]